MTVSTTDSSVEYTTGGPAFPIPFRFLQNSDIQAVLVDQNGNSETLTSAQYTLAGAGAPGGGTLTSTYAAGVLSTPGAILAISRAMTPVQPTDLRNQGRYLAETQETALDRLTMLIQQSLSGLSRALRRPFGKSYFDAESRRIANVQDPSETQDAATKGSVETYVAGILATGQGPINNAQNVVYLYPDNIARPLQTLSSKDNPVLGAAGIGYRGRTITAKLSERIDVTDHWQIGDPSWSDAIDRCIAIAEGAISSTAFPYTVPTIWLPRSFDSDGTYGILRPIRSTLPLQFDGDNARIVALPGFVGATIPLFAGGTEINKSMMIFLHGSKGDTTGQLRWKAKVGKGIILDCQDIALNGIYIERMPYSNIDCEVQFSAADGVQVGPLCWGIGFDEVVIENFTAFGLHFLKDSAANGMSIINPRIWGEFKTGQAGLLFDQDAEANGVSITGGFIEKVDYGVLVASGNGPIQISGVDFEQCTFTVLRAVGNPPAQKVGPINVTGCLLHSISSSKVYCDHATVNVTGCRMYPGSVDFECDVTARGIINASENRYMAGDTVGIAANVTLCYDQNNGLTRQHWNYLSHKATTFFPSYDLRNFQFRDAPQIQSSGFNFYSNYVGGATGQYVGRADWWISEYRHITAPGVLDKVIGVRLANDSAQNSFQPMTNNATTCGAPGASWAGGSTQVAFTVVSDERQKQQIQELSDAERRVAVKCKPLLGLKYKLNDQVEKFGDKAKWHFGTSAQRVIAAFDSEGLDAMEYSVVEYHEWREIEPVLDEAGAVTIPGQPGGNVYTVNYEELQAFALSAS